MIEGYPQRALAAVRRSMPRHAWDAFADVIAKDRFRQEGHLRKPHTEVDRTLLHLLVTLRTEGIVELPFVMPETTVRAIRHHLELHPVHRGPHMYSFDGVPTSLESMRSNYPMAGYRPDQLLRAPALVDFLNQPRIVDFMETYLGCVPTLYSVNAWHSFPAPKPELANVQYFHRDDDDWRFCALFIYLNEVGIREGPHQVIKGSHTLAGMRALLRKAADRGQDASDFDIEKSFVESMGQDFSAKCERLFGDDIATATGLSGSMFVVNTIALHRGLVPTRSPRLMIWARFGIGPNTNSADLEQGPLSRRQIPTELPDTPRNRYINRLLFEYDRGPQHY